MIALDITTIDFLTDLQNEPSSARGSYLLYHSSLPRLTIFLICHALLTSYTGGPGVITSVEVAWNVYASESMPVTMLIDQSIYYRQHDPY